MVTFDYTKTPITQIADYIIMYAAKSGASDIHFDPRENGLMVRIRIDGELQDYSFVPEEYEKNLITRLKLLAKMNITETRLPQDGAIKGTFGGIYLDMRVACLPTNEGEKIAIRILDYSRSLEGLESLGFSEVNYKKLQRMIAAPNGILLVTGATGSGKSTTTYSILQVMNKKETNIITVEDPVEMNIEGLNQVQVNSEIGLTFASVLRSILRQDPNVILIGEIRDSETAKIAVRASITGHFVLSTIHTNDSLSTIERLLDMNVERYLLSSALTGIISQRLAKTLCPHCRFKRETTKYEKKVFSKVLGKEINEIYDAKKDGCKECHNGYKGRIAIQEVLEIDDDIRNALNDENLTKEERKELIYKSDVITLLQDALYKVLDGITSFEEVYRIIEIDDDIADGYSYIEDLKDVNKKKEEQAKKEKQDEVKEDVKSEVNDKVKPLTTAITDKKDEVKEETKTASVVGITPSSIAKDNKVVDVPKVDVKLEKNKDKVEDKLEEKDNKNEFSFNLGNSKPTTPPTANTEEKKDPFNLGLNKPVTSEENKKDVVNTPVNNSSPTDNKVVNTTPLGTTPTKPAATTPHGNQTSTDSAVKPTNSLFGINIPVTDKK